MQVAVQRPLTAEEELILATVKRFFKERVAPEISRIEWIEDHKQRFPWGLIEEASKLGLRVIGAPKEYGGIELSTPFECLLVEEMAATDMSIAVVFEQVWKVARFISKVATKEQKDWFFPKFIQDNRFLLGIAGTEAGVGSDRILPFEESRLGTVARLEGDTWVIDGMKNFISNGADAKLFVVYANTDPSLPLTRGMSAFLVPTDSPGFKVGTVEDKISQRISSNAELIFDHCRIPKNFLLGEINGAGGLARIFIPRSRVGAASTIIGTARAAYELALDYASTRIQGGKAIIEHQLVGATLAEIASKIEAARSFTMRAAWNIDAQTSEAFNMAQMAKYFSSEVCIDACLKAMQVFGHLAIPRKSPIQRYVRDALSFYHSELTQQISLLKIIDEIKKEIGMQPK